MPLGGHLRGQSPRCGAPALSPPSLARCAGPELGKWNPLESRTQPHTQGAQPTAALGHSGHFHPVCWVRGLQNKSPLLEVNSQGSLLEEDTCRLGPRRECELALGREGGNGEVGAPGIATL